MLSDYELNIAGFYKIRASNVLKLVPNVFGKEKYVIH